MLPSDGGLLASGGADGTLRLWEVPGGRLLAAWEASASGVSGVALLGDGQLLASGDSQGTVRRWNPKTQRRLGALHGPTGAVWSVAVSADAGLLASAGWDGTIRLWDTPYCGGTTDPAPGAPLRAHGHYRSDRRHGCPTRRTARLGSHRTTGAGG
jgi:WD40 repeat protein